MEDINNNSYVEFNKNGENYNGKMKTQNINNHYLNKQENYIDHNDNFFDNSISNRIKKIEDLYKYTNNPRRRPMIYSQPDSTPLNNNIISKRRNYSVDTNYKNYNGNNSISNDNNYLEKNSYLRFDQEGVNRAIDILKGKI